MLEKENIVNKFLNFYTHKIITLCGNVITIKKTLMIKQIFVFIKLFLI